MRYLFTISIIFLFMFNISASDQLNLSGAPGAIQLSSPTLKTINITENLPEEKGSFHTSKLNNNFDNLIREDEGSIHNRSIESQPSYVILEKLSVTDRENSLIEIELTNVVSQETNQWAQSIQTLWNNGNYQQAINDLKSFEVVNENMVSGIGFSWKEPKLISGIEGVDVQIGTRTGIHQTELDFDVSNGHLFATLLYYDGSSYNWSVNISTDGGASWSETYIWVTLSSVINDVDAAVVGGYFWVGHISFTTQDVARMRRFNTTDGMVDPIYSYQTIFNFNIEIRDISIFSNADAQNNRIYFAAITDDDSLRFYSSDQDGITWYDFSTDIADADHGLDASWNTNSTNYFICMSYVNVNGQLYTILTNGTPWTNVSLAPATTNTSDVTSIAAYQDTIIIVYEAASDLTYRISYDGGTSWTFGTLASGTTFYKPHVTGRMNGGFAAVYVEEAGAFDPVWFVRREYSVPGWSSPLQVNEIDAMSSMWNNIEWIPPVSEPYAHGVIFPFFDGSGANAYFDRVENIPVDPPDISVSPTFFNFVVPEGGTDTGILTIFNNAVAGSEDLIWNISDQVAKMEMEDGSTIPVKIHSANQKIKNLDYTSEHSIGPAPLNKNPLVQQTNKINNYEFFDPTDFGYGPEYNNAAIAEFMLNDPTIFNFGATYPQIFYAAAEFGNDGNFSFMYCLDFSSNELVTIDNVSGAITLVGPASPFGGESWTGLAMDPTSGIMYASSTSVTVSSLYTIDLGTGVTTRVGEITNVPAIIAIAIDNSGQMYGYDIVTDSLVSVDKLTAAGTQIGPLGFDANLGQGMDFDESDGTLYLAAYNGTLGVSELRIADPITGLTTLVGSMGSTTPGGSIQMGGFGVATQGDCPWISALPANGTIAAGGSENVTVSVDAAGILPGAYLCNLNLSSNDPDEPLVTIPVELIVEGAPAISISPLSVTETVSYGDSAISPIQIQNNGSVDLHWYARVTDFKNLASNPHFTTEQIGQALTALNQNGAVEKTNNDTREPNVDLIKGKSKWFSTEQFVLWDNGPLANSPGTGAGGADESVLQNTSLGMSTLGFGHQVSANNRISDDFVVTGDNWTVDNISFFAYQTNSDTNSTMTEVNYRVWDGPPGQPGSNVVFGDTSTNMLIATTWSHIYRVTETSSGNTARPIMMNTVLGGFSLTPGRYWLDWQTGGTLASGPWAPPVTVTGMDSTGDAWQYTGAWLPVIDGGSGKGQDFPFIIDGTADNLWMRIVGPVSGTITPGNSFDMDLRLYGVIPDSVFTGEITFTSNDPTQPVLTIPVELTVLPPNSIGPSDVGVVKTYALLHNYPNPFNPSTTIKYRLASLKPQSTVLQIYNNLGQLVRTLVNADQGNGEYSVVWNGLDNNNKEVASGIYFYKLQSGEFISTQKLLKLK